METSTAEALVGALARIDPRCAVWCTCQCLRTVLHLVPEDEARPGIVIAAAEAWTRGQVTERACWEAADAAGAVRGRHRVVADLAVDITACCNRYGLHIHDLSHIVSRIESVVWHTHRTRQKRRVRSWNPDGRRVHDDRPRVIESEKFEAYKTRLHELVSSQRWPLCLPTPEQLAAAPEAVAVAWDLVATDARTEHTVPELLEAHARAERLGLDWSDPVARAVAERALDEAHIRTLLR